MSKSLMGVKRYGQQEKPWSDLTPDFAANGCAVCSAATIANYKESGTVTPATLQDRGVFSKQSAYFNNWGNVSQEFSFQSKEHVGDLAGALREIKNQIDTYSDPVMLVVATAGGMEHYVVAYGYSGSCTSENDVKIRDSMPTNYTTLGAAMRGTYPTFVRMNRII